MNSDDPVAPYETLVYHGSSIKIDTKGKTVVVPTGNPTLLPLFNEYVQNADRLTTAESPFGGLKGSGSPDYAPGTLNVILGDGIYLQDVNGQNSTKTLTAGKLKELNLMSVDTTGHTITEEFIIANTGTSNNPTVIDNCDSATGWSMQYGTGEITVHEGTLLFTGTTTALGQASFIKPVTLDISGKQFISFDIKSSIAGTIRCSLYDGTSIIAWTGASFAFQADTWTHFVFPLLAPQGTSGMNPTTKTGVMNLSTIAYIYFGIEKAGNTQAITLQIDNITADTAKSAYIELQTPDNLADSSLTLQVWDGSAYQTTGVYKLDSSYSAVSTTSANWKLSDGTKFDDCYGSGNGRALFPKGASEETKAGSSGSITYSANKGTSKRIGFRVDLPPSDGGRTNFNKCRMKAVLSYTDTVGNVVPDLSGNNNTGTLVGGVTKLNDGGLQFDGVNGAISHGNMCGSGYIKVSADVIFTSIPSAHRYVISKHGSWYMGLYNGLFMARIIIGGVDRMVTYNAGITTNTLYTLEMEYDGEYINGWINGTRVIHSNYPGTMSTASSILYVGREDVYSGYIQETVHKYAVYQNDVLKISCIPTVSNMGSTTHDFADSTNASYGLHHMVKPWIALLEDDTQEIDFYLFDERPKNLKYKQDESGKIYELEVFPGNGNCYHGRIKYSGLTRDTNSDGIPDCLDPDVEGSITKFLKTLDFFH